MTKDDIIRMARDVGFSDGEIDTCQLMFERFAAIVASAERDRIFGDLLKMHEMAKSQHNYFLHAVLTLKAKGQA